MPPWIHSLLRSLPGAALRQKTAWKLHLLQDWWGTRVWKKTSEVLTPLGFKLTSGFHPAYKMMREGTFEPEETALIAQLLPSMDGFIDIGANLGYYTCLALQAGKPVVAFEPQEQNLRCLFQNLTINGWQDRAEVFPLALSEKPGLLTLYGASGPSASLVRNWAGYSPRYSKVVPVSTLDRVLGTTFGGKRLLIKIDVEGAEYQVLKGALGTLEMRPRPVWLLEVCMDEFHPSGLNPDFERIFRLFWDAGYRAYTASRSPTPVTPEDVRAWLESRRSDSGTFNYLFADPAQVVA
jgi:FkbM family methyltransferase